MYFVKEINGKKVVLECEEKNHESIYVREGFVACDKKGEPITPKVETIEE